MKAIMPIFQMGDLIRFDKVCYGEKLKTREYFAIPQNTVCFYDGTHNGFMRVISPTHGIIVCALPMNSFKYFTSMFTFIARVSK